MAVRLRVGFRIVVVASTPEFGIEILAVPVAPVQEVGQQVADRIFGVGTGQALELPKHGISPIGTLVVGPLRVSGNGLVCLGCV